MSLNTYQQKISGGTVLVAQTSLLDVNFMMSVVLVCHHDEDGSFGLLLNRPTHFFLNPDDFEISVNNSNPHHHPVFIGGPVQPEALFFLYARDEELEDSTRVNEGVYLSSSQNTLQKLKDLGEFKRESVRLFLGYSGWSFYQLDCEASSDSWFVHPAQKDLIFYDVRDNLWLDTLGSIGEEFYRYGQKFMGSFEEKTHE